MKKFAIILLTILVTLDSGMLAQEGKKWTLEECISYALEQNITVRKQGLSNQSLNYLADQAKAQRLPSANASINQSFKWNRPYTTNDGITEYGTGFEESSGTSYTVNTGVTVFNASRITNQIKQTQLDMEGGKYDLETIRENISLQILNAFLQVIFAEEQVNNSRKQIESTTEQVNLATERLNLQVISQSDYLQVKSQLASEKLNLANAASQLAISKVILMQLMEIPVTESFEVAKPDMESTLNQQRFPLVQEIFDTALVIKPEIKSAAIDKEIASLDEKIARAGYYPVLSASAGISTNAEFGGKSTYGDQMDNMLSPSAGLSLSIPIYQRKQIKTNVALAKIGYETASLSEVETRNQLRKKIEQACQDVKSAQTEYEASVEKYSSTRESALLSDEKFTNGLINSVDYLVSKTNLIVSESELLQSKFNLIFSYKILDFYTGKPLTL
jgi:outer membrane protein